MHCPACHNLDTKVIDSRVLEDGSTIRRRRECEKCNFRFSTVEEVEILNLSVIKNNGSEQSYNKDKLVRGMQKALEKRQITSDKFKSTVHNIERDIQITAQNDRIKSKEIGEIVMKHLKKIDKIAYIRFASIYQDFEDLETFQAELNKLINTKRCLKKAKKEIA